IALQRGFADQVHALPVVGFGFCRIGGNDLVEGRDRIIHLARIGENSTLVEQVGAGVRRIQLDRLVIVGHGIVDPVGLRIGFGKVVIVGGHFHIIVGIFLCRLRGAAQVNCLLVIGCRQFVTLLFFGGIGLLGPRHAVGVAEFEPDQIAGAVDLVGFVQGSDCGLEVAGIGSCLGGGQSFVERANGLPFALCLSQSLLRLRGLFSVQSLALDCCRLLFFQVEVQQLFVHAYRDVVDVPEFFAVFAELDVVLAGNDAKREVLALVVGFKL